MCLLIILAFSLLIGLFFKRNVLVPIGDLISLTQAIAKGDLSRRTRAYGTYEFSQLARAFNEMSDELARSKDEIQNFNLSLRERVDEVSAQLKEKQAQLLESEKLASLGVLSSGIAHEINNPLGIILGHTQMILKNLKSGKGLTEAQEVEKLLEEVEINTKRCSRIVSSLLHFARKKEVNREDTAVAQILDNALVFASGRLSSKGIKVEKEVDASLPVIPADPVQLEQVFINIIFNAEQSMAEGGRLVIRAEAPETDKGYFTLVFKDNGKGIAAKDLSRIFDPFFSTKDPGQGSGLGLSLSYGIIKAHGGDIRITSKKGKGTRAIVVLPVKR